MVQKVFLKLIGKAILKLVYKVTLELRSSKDRDNGRSLLKIYACGAQETHAQLRDLDYTQIDERMAVMLNAILQLEAQGECRESATEAVLMVGYTT